MLSFSTTKESTMKHIARIAVTTALALAGAAAHAQYYVEGAYTPTTIKIEDGAKLKPAMLSATVGYDLHPNFAVEAMLGLGAKKDSATDGTNSGSIKYKHAYGVYLKPRYQLSQEFEIFGRAGFTHGKLEGSDSTGGNGNVSGGTFSWGLGGNYAIDKQLYLTASYMNFYKKDGLKIDGFNLGVGYKF